MAVFAIHYEYPDDTTDLLAMRPEHRDWLSQQPGVLLAGRYQGGLDVASTGDDAATAPAHAALIVVTADSLERVTAAFDDDPYWRAGLVRRRVVREWNPPLGEWAEQP